MSVLIREYSKNTMLKLFVLASLWVFIFISLKNQHLNEEQIGLLKKATIEQLDSVGNNEDRTPYESTVVAERIETNSPSSVLNRNSGSVTTQELTTQITNEGLKPLHVERLFKSPIDCQTMVENKDAEQLFRADGLTRFYRDYRDDRLQDESDNLKKYLEDLKMIPDENFIFDESRCDEFVDKRGYNNYTVTDEEKAFPLAITIRTYEQVEQFERLLRVVYRPHNVYCIHVDLKSKRQVLEAVKSIARCFPNVFIATKLVQIYWSSHGLLIADLNCMRDLLMPALESKGDYDDTTKAEIEAFWSHENLKNKKIPQNWKYLLNLASTDFPLKTNRELVQILTVYNGTNDIEYTKFPEKFQHRIHYHHHREPGQPLVRTDELKAPPPFNLTIFKSHVFSSFSRAFVNYSISAPHAKALLDWLNDTRIPDESFFGTLQYNVQFNPPGSFERILPDTYMRHMSRFLGWPYNYQCDKAGYRRHDLCMFTNGDLNFLINRPEFFANKFQLVDDPIAYSCMEDWYLRRHQRENELTKNGTQLVIDKRPYCRHLHQISSGKVYPGCEFFFEKV